MLWVPWALVAVTAIALWTHTYSGHRWSVQPDQFGVHLLAWTAMLALVAALSGWLQRYTDAGIWGLRTAVTLAVASITLTALGGLFFRTVGTQYPVGLLVMAVGAGVVGTRRLPDVFTLSALALGLNALLVGGLVRWLGDGSWSHDWLGRLLLIGLFAAGLLAASVSAILKISRQAAKATNKALDTGESA